MKILVVDDDTVTVSMLEALLQDEGHEVVTAFDGRDVQKCLQGGALDLVITDIFMPEQDGLVTIARLREEHPSLRVIAISGGASSLGKVDALRAAQLMGADAVLAKPLQADQVLRVVETVANKGR
ncbi:response regulator [Oleidesulfovibrio sp.]|uniref:response regulator n=1 Tax=Oleidesulfovibrio sp. TaxID=2909707 RepID=UPI003A83B08E